VKVNDRLSTQVSSAATSSAGAASIDTVPLMAMVALGHVEARVAHVSPGKAPESDVIGILHCSCAEKMLRGLWRQ
jgi:hypothetical protein